MRTAAARQRQLRGYVVRRDARQGQEIGQGEELMTNATDEPLEVDQRINEAYLRIFREASRMVREASRMVREARFYGRLSTK
jgi:hypothetical protein